MKISCALAFLLLANLVLVSMAQADAEAEAQAEAQERAASEAAALRGQCGCPRVRWWLCSWWYRPVCARTRYGHCTFYNRCVLNQCIRSGNAAFIYNGRCRRTYYGESAEATAEATAEA